jgi:hypothetical protein
MHRGTRIFMFLPPTNAPPPCPRHGALGNLSVFPDHLIGTDIVHYLTNKELLVLSSASKILRLIIMTDKTWKRMVLQKTATIQFQGTWKKTAEFHKTKRITDYQWHSVYFSPYLSGLNALRHFDLQSIDSCASDTQDRVCVFKEGEMCFERLLEFERYCEPFMVLTGTKTSWISNSIWKLEELSKFAGNRKVLVGNQDGNPHFVIMTMNTLIEYFATQADECPLYLFDKGFGEEIPFLLKAYNIPDFVCEDLLYHLGPNRPAFRWLVIGPMRTGASWHVDPPGTSAWNTLISGRKLWALYPPQKEPPGARGNESSLLWFSTVFPTLGPLDRPLLIVQNPGDTIVVPSGWWHCVLNLISVNIAVTQNFCSRIYFSAYLKNLKKSNPEVPNCLSRLFKSA